MSPIELCTLNYGLRAQPPSGCPAIFLNQKGLAARRRDLTWRSTGVRSRLIASKRKLCFRSTVHDLVLDLEAARSRCPILSARACLRPSARMTPVGNVNQLDYERSFVAL